MDLQLRGRRVLVSGGSRGIGKAVARTFLAEGAQVAIAARGQSDLAAASEALCAETGRSPAVVVGDTGTDAGAADVVTGAESSLGGGVDILINCAARPGRFLPAGLSNLTSD